MTLPNRNGDVQIYRSKYWRTNWLMTYSPISQTWTPIYSNPKDCPPPVSSGTCVKYLLVKALLACTCYVDYIYIDVKK